MKTNGHTEHNNVDHISVPMEDKYQKLAKSIEEDLPTGSPLSPGCCIFRVPEVLRRNNNPNVFEPDIVAIGPFHRKKQSLQPMEQVKKWYLRTLLKRLNVNVLDLIGGIKEFETEARECYQGPIDVDDEKNEFLGMMVIDGCFLIEFFRKLADPGLISSNDPLVDMACMTLYHDLLLLENQLPWFILEKLYDLTEPYDQINLPLDHLVLQYFKPYFSMTGITESRRFSCLHIVHLIREALVYSYDTGNGPFLPYVYRAEHIPCVTRLLKAGVKFKKVSAGSMLNITFENGTFKIPTFLFDESTEPMFRNLIAFEQCYSNCQDKITSYAILMDNLINTCEDVEHLRNKGIIQNWLSAEDTSDFFNGLYINTSVSHFYYGELCGRVNEYCQKEWPGWIATLVHDHFKNPWTIISLVAAFILLVLTFLQTFYTVK